MGELPHILVVDDDRRIRALLQSYLRDHGYLVSVAASAEEAKVLMEGLAFDLLIVDVMMPGEGGLALVSGLRARRQNVPVLMLSALSESSDKIAGLATGSDDYLAKPFEPEELLLRLKSLLRRSGAIANASAALRFGEFVFHVASNSLDRSGVAVRLTSREREILKLLCLKPGEPVGRDALAEGGGETATRKVDVQINRLRQKIEADPANPRHLVTMRGAGYALMAEPL
jgi:two-component system, OmpR family, phosphate regulon response regulator OmpR